MLGLGATPWLISLGTPSLALSLSLWCVGLLVEFTLVTVIAYVPKLFLPLNIEHITDRFSDMFFIILGESFESVIFTESGLFEWQPYFLSACGVILAFSFQSFYFDVEERYVVILSEGCPSR
jgi:low temperature requirement protein LtrA